jgi:hypothetical protein
MLKQLGYEHHVLDCKRPMESEFEDVYRTNYFPVHQDWMKIAGGLHKVYPKEKLCIKGVASGIVKFYYRRLEKKPSLKNAYQLAGYEPGWQNHAFIVDFLDSWLEDAKNVCRDNKIEVLDLLYWEHRIGGWQAQSQNEWDMVMDQFTPYVTRPWLELMFAVGEHERRMPGFSIFPEMMKVLWPELLDYPVNPPQTFTEKLIPVLRNLSGVLGIYEPLRRFYTRRKY